MNIISAAEELGRVAHSGQKRKYNGHPYFEHPTRVAMRTATRPGATEEMVAAAFLHDVIEDTKVTGETIAKATNPRVLELVEWMTNRSKQTHPTANRAERKKIDRERLAGAPREAKIIKLIDRIDNLKEMGGSDPGFAKLYAQESLLLCDVLQDADAELAGELRGIAQGMLS